MSDKKEKSESFFNKSLVGKTVVFMPEDNSVIRGGSHGDAFAQATEGVFLEIRRTKAVVKVNGREQTFSFSENNRPRLSSDHNYGYRVFATWDDFHAYRIAEKVAFRLRNGDLTSVSDEQYKKIAEIMGWHELLNS